MSLAPDPPSPPKPNWPPLHRIPSLYAKGDASWKTRFFINARWKLTPYPAIAAHFPKAGRIIDLGCGHGLLAITLALESSQREVMAIDHDEARVELARQASSEISNLSFERGSLLAPPPGPWDGAAAIDVFHYFEPRVQEALLGAMRSALSPMGVFVFREVDPHQGVASRFNRFYEKIATQSGFTQTKNEGLHFRSRKDWTRQIEKSGFEVSSERCSSAVFADILYVCRPR